jgi:SdrD B-like domain
MQGTRSSAGLFRRSRAAARTLALACLVLSAGALLPASAAASFPWADQAALQNETDGALRATFILDTAPGATISRQLFLSQPYLGFYEGEGFDRNFFTWAPHTAVGDDYMAGKGWTGCGSVQIAVPGGPSYCGLVKFGAPGSMRADVLSGPLTGFKWGEDFISDICGNWSPANTAAKASPEPVISGVKYEDLNANGVRDPGEPGISGWKIELLYEGSHVATTTTGAGGAYSFHLDADTLSIGGGTYTLKEESREGWHQEEAPGPVVVPFGAGDTTYGGNDFGNWRPATISGHKFDDSNVDGAWGKSEKALPEWGIQLSNGDEILTGAEGSYSFSVRPGTYAAGEALQSGWRQTSPGGSGTRKYTVVSGQVVEGADFGNVCFGGVAVEPFDDSAGKALAGLEVRLEEVSVPGILENEPPLPRTTTGAPDFTGLLPGTYRVVAFLPEGVFTTDPDAILEEGRFAIVKEVTVSECKTTKLPLHLFTKSTPGKVTGGIRIAVPGGFATAGFEFMTQAGSPRGTLEYQDHATSLNLHTAAIEAIYVSGNVAWVWGKLNFAGVQQRFRLRLVDEGEPGRKDRFELTVASGYEAGQGGPIADGNVQIHK